MTGSDSAGACGASGRARRVQARRRCDGASAQALATVADGRTAVLRRSRALALSARTAALAALGRPADAQHVAEEIICEFADDPIQGPKRANVVAGGRFARAMMLLAQQEVGLAQTAFADLIVDYGDHEAPSVMLVVAKARLQQARALQRLDDVDTATSLRLD